MSEQHSQLYVHASLSLPAATQIPTARCSPTTVTPGGETSTSTSCIVRAQLATSKSTEAAPIDPADWMILPEQFLPRASLDKTKHWEVLVEQNAYQKAGTVQAGFPIQQ